MDEAIAHRAWQVAEDILRPNAAAADTGDIHGVVTSNIRALGEAGLFALGIPKEYGGLEADDVTRHEYTEIIASCCGVTAFTQQQLQMGIYFLCRSDNEPLKRELLPKLASGATHCSIGLSQLRRSGLPLIRAEKTRGGYRLNGTLPWITGWELLDGFVLAGVHMGTGQHIYAYIDMERHRECLQASAPLELVVMNASCTVEVSVVDLVLPEDQILNILPPDELKQEDDRCITSHCALPLGCSRASAHYLRELGMRQNRENVTDLALALTWEIDRCRHEALTWNCQCMGHPEYRGYALRARAAAIVLAVRAAHAAIAATGGSAHLRNSVAQRFLREAQFYTTAAQTADIRSNTLDQLISPFFGA